MSAVAEKVAITGATGLIGSRLTESLTGEGVQVVALTRDVRKAKQVLPKEAEAAEPGEWKNAIKECKQGSVVNLAGEPISRRWNDAVKAEIMRSRKDTTGKLVQAVNECGEEERPRALVSASAVGYYGTELDGTFEETSSSGNDFLAQVCREWEAEAKKAEAEVSIVRMGIVLSRNGGVLGQLEPIYKLFLGGPPGSGEQWVSFVHIDDAVGVLKAAMRARGSGVYNATAPHPVRMGDLCNELGKSLGRPSWLPVPGEAVKLGLGEGAKLVLEGQRVLPTKTQNELGFEFQFPTIAGALAELYKPL